jgi:hypothetical protein
VIEENKRSVKTVGAYSVSEYMPSGGSSHYKSFCTRGVSC